MVERDMILDGSYMPDYDEIGSYIRPPARELWLLLNDFIRERYKAEPRITFSACAGKPGWNVKYQRSGKSICTLYPEKEGFIALVVVTLDLLPLIEALSEKLTPAVRDTVKGAKPFNGTLWLMLRVDSPQALEDVKQLLILKQAVKRTSKSGQKPVI